MAERIFAPEIKKNDEPGKSPRLRLLYAIVAVGKIRLARISVSDYHAGVDGTNHPMDREQLMARRMLPIIGMSMLLFAAGCYQTETAAQDRNNDTKKKRDEFASDQS